MFRTEKEIDILINTLEYYNERIICYCEDDLQEYQKLRILSNLEYTLQDIMEMSDGKIGKSIGKQIRDIRNMLNSYIEPKIKADSNTNKREK